MLLSRGIICEKGIGNNYLMKISLIENMYVGLIIIKGGENIKGIIGEQQDANLKNRYGIIREMLFSCGGI